MEEVLVWMMGDAEGTRVLIGSFGKTGVIYRKKIPGIVGVEHGSYRYASNGIADQELIDITDRAERYYEMLLPPTVLRLPPAPAFSDDRLYFWVDGEVLPVVETRMKMLRVEEIRRKQATGRLS